MDIRGSMASSATREGRASLGYRNPVLKRNAFKHMFCFKAQNTVV